MIQITVYETSSGRILRTVSAGRLEDAELNVTAGEELIPGQFDGDQYYVAGGMPAEYPPKPGPWASFDYGSGSWIDPRTPAEVAADLDESKAAAAASVNTAIGLVRRKFVTDIPGQDMLYLRKEAEAIRWLSDPAPDLASFPLISAEIGITGEDGDQIAQVWVNMADLWSGVAAQLETLRLGHIAQIEVAADQAQVDAALTAFGAAVEELS